MHPEFRFPHAQRASAESADNAQRAGQQSELVLTEQHKVLNVKGVLVPAVSFHYADGTITTVQ